MRVDVRGRGPSVPAPSMLVPRFWFAAAKLRSGAVVVGGGEGREGLTAEVEVWGGGGEGRWTPLQSLPEPVFWCEGVALGEDFVVLGGMRGLEEGAVGAVRALRVGEEAAVWRDLPSLLTPRYDFAAAAVGGCVLAIGGVGPNRQTLESIEVLDEAQQKWRSLPLRLPFGGLSNFSAAVTPSA